MRVCAGRTGPQGIQPSPQGVPSAGPSVAAGSSARRLQTPDRPRVAWPEKQRRKDDDDNHSEQAADPFGLHVGGRRQRGSLEEIGALWAHEDGQGFNLTLKACPSPAAW